MIRSVLFFDVHFRSIFESAGRLVLGMSSSKLELVVIHLEGLDRDLVVFLVSKGSMTSSDNKVVNREARRLETSLKSLRSFLEEVVSEDKEVNNKLLLNAAKTSS